VGAGETNLDVEQLDDRVRKAREIVEHFNDTDRLYERGFIDRYASRDFEIICRPAVRRPFPERSEQCLVVCRNDPSAKFWSESVTRKIWGDAKAGCMENNLKQSVVFPLDVELMKDPKQIIPSLVRLQRFNECSWRLGEPIYKLMSLVVPRSEMTQALGNREPRIFGIDYVVPSRERNSQNIQATSERVEISPELNIKSEREQLIIANYQRIVSRWRWQLFDSHLHVSSEPRIDFGPESWEFGYGPINACLSF
jgi:hypothetical protein